MVDIAPFIAAYRAHQYVLLGALVVGLLVALSKQGWFSTWIASKLTPAVIPYYALGVAVLGVVTADLKTGKTWQQAVLDAFMAGFAAIGGHQLLIESGRKGKELVPATDAVYKLRTTAASALRATEATVAPKAPEDAQEPPAAVVITEKKETP